MAENLDRSLSVRVTRDEERLLRAAAARDGLTLSQFLRRQLADAIAWREDSAAPSLRVIA